MVTAMFEQVGLPWLFHSFICCHRVRKYDEVLVCFCWEVCSMDPELPAEVIDAVFKARSTLITFVLITFVPSEDWKIC